MQELIHELPVQPAPRRSRPKTILALLILLGALAAGGYFLWQEMYPDSTAPQLQSLLKDGTKASTDPNSTFANPKNGVAVAVGSCTVNQEVKLGTTGTIVFSGMTTLMDEPYCEMVLTANGKYGPGTFDCSFKLLDDRPEIYLHLDDTGADQDFIRQYCTFRE